MQSPSTFIVPRCRWSAVLAFSTTEEELRTLFGEHGSVTSVSLITDRETGRPRGFGFVEMSQGAERAISQLDGKEIGGRTLKVNEARPREDNRGGGGGRPRY